MRARERLVAALLLSLPAVASCSAQSGNGYWTGEYRALQQQFDDLASNCAEAKKEWGNDEELRYVRVQNWAACLSYLNGNVFVLDFGQAPANNLPGAGIGLQGIDNVSFLDSQRRARDFEPRWKIVGDSSVNGSWTAYATGDVYVAPYKARRFDNPYVYFFGGSQQANTLAYFGEGEQTPATSANYSMRRSAFVLRAEEPIWKATPLHHSIRVAAEFGSRWYDAGGGPAPSVTAQPSIISPSLPSSLHYVDESFLLKAANIDWSGTPEGYWTGSYLRHTDTLEARFMNRTAETSTYSYRQFWIEEQHDVTIRCKLRGADERNVVRRAPRSLKDCFTLQFTGSVTESAAGAGRTVPFFLQPTVGGSDVNNLQTLPSYANYRFRAPNVEFGHVDFLAPAMYSHIPFVDALPLAFYVAADTGKAALRRDDLSVTHMRHSYSAGVSLTIGKLAVVNLYYSWGGHEGGRLQDLLLPPTLGNGVADYW